MRNVTALICGDPPRHRSALVPESERYKSMPPQEKVIKIRPQWQAQSVMCQRLPIDKAWQEAELKRVTEHEINYTEISKALKAAFTPLSATGVSEGLRGMKGVRPELMTAITRAIDGIIEEMKAQENSINAPKRKYQRGPDRPYTKSEIDLIIRLYMSGMSVKLIAQKVNIKFGNNRTHDSIRGKVKRMGLKR